MTLARAVLSALLLFGGLGMILRRVVIGWSTWRHLLEVGLGGLAMGLALVVAQPDSVAKGVGQTLFAGVAFAALCWWFVTPESPDEDGAEAVESDPVRSTSPPVPTSFYRALRYGAILLLLSSIVWGILWTAGLSDSFALRLVVVLGVVAFVFCLGVSIKVWLLRR